MQRVHQRTFEGLVVFGERSIGHPSERYEQTPNALGNHDEWAHVIFGWGVRFEIGNVNAHPALLGFVPPNLASRGVPGLAIAIAGGAIIENAAIRWPRPRPVGIDAKARRVFRAAPLNHGARFGPIG